MLGQPVGLRLDSVSRVFKAGEVRVRAVDDVSFEIAPGEYVAVMGPSGCGKTTLLSLLGGLDKPTSGHVYAAGSALDQLTESELADYRLQRAGTVFQTFNLVPTLSAEDNVALPLALAGVDDPERRRRARLLLSVLGLEGRESFKPTRLSGGEQQRVAIARALANRPGVILADEPTGNLDSKQGEQVLDVIQDLHRQGATVVLVTHDPAVAARADRVVYLQDGHLARTVRSRRRTARAPEPLDPPTRLSRWDAIRLGLSNVSRRPMRSVLTAGGVGMGIGVMALILALAVGVQSEAAAAGNGRMQQVLIGTDPTQKQPRVLDQGSVTALRHLPHVRGVWGQVAIQGGMVVKGAKPADQPPPPAVMASLPPKSEWSGNPAGTLLSGRLPARDGAPEIVLSNLQAARLGIQPANAVGQKVDFTATFSQVPGPGVTPEKVDQPSVQTLTIVGVSREDPLGGAMAGGWVPYDIATAYWSKLADANAWKGPEFQLLVARADDNVHVDFVRDQSRLLGFGAQSQDDALRAEQEHLVYLEVALAGLALVALVVAFVGIVNTMYTAVLERTTEVGVLKAIGARSGDIRVLFTAEAALIGAMAGLVGVIIAVLLARLGNAGIARLAQARGAGLHVTLFQPMGWILGLAIALAVILSALSGLLPASRAARLEAVQALRHE